MRRTAFIVGVTVLLIAAGIATLLMVTSGGTPTFKATWVPTGMQPATSHGGFYGGGVFGVAGESVTVPTAMQPGTLQGTGFHGITGGSGSIHPFKNVVYSEGLRVIILTVLRESDLPLTYYDSFASGWPHDGNLLVTTEANATMAMEQRDGYVVSVTGLGVSRAEVIRFTKGVDA